MAKTRYNGELDLFAAWLRDRMAERPDLNQPRLASMLGVYQSTISNWVRGRSAPTTENLEALATIFSRKKAEVLRLLGIIDTPHEFSPEMAAIVEALDQRLSAIEDPRVKEVVTERLKADLKALTDTVERLADLVESLPQPK